MVTSKMEAIIMSLRIVALLATFRLETHILLLFSPYDAKIPKIPILIKLAST